MLAGGAAYYFGHLGPDGEPSGPERARFWTGAMIGIGVANLLRLIGLDALQEAVLWYNRELPRAP